MQKRLFLLDAMALIFRAYYALMRSPRITSTGKNTNAQFGFTNALLELLNNQRPTHMAVCFDTKELTERHIDFADYKANRQEAPEDLVEAIPDIKRIIEGFNIPCIEANGFEADDIIGTLAKKAELEGYEVYMVTPDKDYGQLVSEHIKIYKPGTQGGKAEILGPEDVCAKWGIQTVDQVIEILGLMGDSVDNIPGIPGIGEKTAAKLIREYGSIDNILAHADQIKGAVGEKIRNDKDLAVMSRKLATIILNVPVEFHEENFLVREPDKEKLLSVFTDLEFKTLGKRILGEEISIAPKPIHGQMDLFGNVDATSDKKEVITELPTGGKNIDNTPHQYHLIEGEKPIDQLVEKLMKFTEISFDTETTGLDARQAELVGISFSVKPGEVWYIPFP
jgi:DNA polymerase-1